MGRRGGVCRRQAGRRAGSGPRPGRRLALCVLPPEPRLHPSPLAGSRRGGGAGRWPSAPRKIPSRAQTATSRWGRVPWGPACAPRPAGCAGTRRRRAGWQAALCLRSRPPARHTRIIRAGVVAVRRPSRHQRPAEARLQDEPGRPAVRGVWKPQLLRTVRSRGQGQGGRLPLPRASAEASSVRSICARSCSRRPGGRASTCCLCLPAQRRRRHVCVAAPRRHRRRRQGAAGHAPRGGRRVRHGLRAGSDH